MSKMLGLFVLCFLLVQTKAATEDSLFYFLAPLANKYIFTNHDIFFRSNETPKPYTCESDERWMPMHLIYGHALSQKGNYACVRPGRPSDSVYRRLGKPGQPYYQKIWAYSNSPRDRRQFYRDEEPGFIFDMKITPDVRVRFNMIPRYNREFHPESGIRAYEAKFTSLTSKLYRDEVVTEGQVHFINQPYSVEVPKHGEMHWYWLDSTHWLFTHTITKEGLEGDSTTAEENLYEYWGDENGLITHGTVENTRGGKSMDWTTIYLQDGLLRVDTEERKANNNYIPVYTKRVWNHGIMGYEDYRRKVLKE